MGMRKKELRVIGKPSAELNCELLDSDSEAGMTKEERSSGMTPSSTSFPGRWKSGKGDESGRSMVEMLGVLAIMGVLAIGGIIGYRYAVDKYNANEIINQ